jgi:hypothetical protein
MYQCLKSSETIAEWLVSNLRLTSDYQIVRNSLTLISHSCSASDCLVEDYLAHNLLANLEFLLSCFLSNSTEIKNDYDPVIFQDLIKEINLTLSNLACDKPQEVGQSGAFNFILAIVE